MPPRRRVNFGDSFNIPPDAVRGYPPGVSGRAVSTYVISTPDGSQLTMSEGDADIGYFTQSSWLQFWPYEYSNAVLKVSRRTLPTLVAFRKVSPADAAALLQTSPTIEPVPTPVEAAGRVAIASIVLLGVLVLVWKVG